MPKLKPITLEQHLVNQYGEKAEDLEVTRSRLGMNLDNAVGFAAAHALMETGRYYSTISAEPGHEKRLMDNSLNKYIVERVTTWVKARIKA